MLYRMNTRIKTATRILGLPVLGMLLAISLSATKAWAPAEIATKSQPFVIVLH